jgi:hypothetical protein
MEQSSFLDKSELVSATEKSDRIPPYDDLFPAGDLTVLLLHSGPLSIDHCVRLWRPIPLSSYFYIRMNAVFYC